MLISVLNKSRIGIQNCGNSCYLNSLLQLLYSITDLHDIINIKLVDVAKLEEISKIKS